MKKLLLFTLCGVLIAPSTTVYADELIFAQCDEYINVRTDADIDSNLVGKIYNNNAATVLEEDGDWIKIKSGNVEGWVCRDYFTTDEAVAQNAAYNVAEVYPEVLNVRMSPSEDSDTVGIATVGDELEVVDYEGDWAKICLQDGTYGYVSAYYVGYNTYYGTAETLEEEADRLDAAWLAYLEFQSVQEEENYDYLDSEYNYEYSYDESADYYEEDYSYPQEENYYIPEENYTDNSYYEDTSYNDSNNDYYYEETVDNTVVEDNSYYEDTSYEENVEDNSSYEEDAVVEESAPVYNSTGSTIVNYALSYVGCSYVWGGTSPSGFDCSGLVQYCSNLAGISTPRTAASQYSGGTQISISEAVSTPGALLFYHDFGHVAISIGDGTVVHASSSTTGVIISNAYYSAPCGAAKYF
jgi:cell wall-associated NlpC family hydrolase